MKIIRLIQISLKISTLANLVVQQNLPQPKKQRSIDNMILKTYIIIYQAIETKHIYKQIVKDY